MKHIVLIDLGTGSVTIVQCVRCKEVFAVVNDGMASVSVRRKDAVALGERHKKECPVA